MLSIYCLSITEVYNCVFELSLNEVNFTEVFYIMINFYPQVVTCEGWSELMYLIQDSSSSYAWIYFVSFITVSFCL